MFYISRVTLINRYGVDFLVRIADRNRDRKLDVDPVDGAIRDAEAECNSYLGAVLTLPLPGVTDRPDPENNTEVPEALRRVCNDIAVYRLASEHDVLTKEKRKRYEDAITWLKGIASQQISLGNTAELTTVDYFSSPRIMTRSKLSGLV